jgi:hypothetical protein
MKPLKQYNLIGISGKIGSGKDTAAAILNTLSNNRYEVKKFAGKLKQIAGLLCGVDPIWFESQEFKMEQMPVEWGGMTYRAFLQRLGTEALRDGLHTQVWVNALFSDYRKEAYKWDADGNATIEGFPNWIITDVRFPNEADAIREKGGFLLRIERPGSAPGTHPSETALDTYAFDYTLHNGSSLYNLEIDLQTLYEGI